MNEFFKKAGTMAIGTRLRMLSERVTKESEALFALEGVELKPKWFGVFFTLSHADNPMTITTIAQELGYAHPSVISIVKEMKKNDLIVEEKDKNDGRKIILTLSTKARKMADIVDEQCIDVKSAIDKMLEKTTHDLWVAIEEFEKLLDEESIEQRVKSENNSRKVVATIKSL